MSTEVIAPNYQQLYVQGVARAETLLSYLRAQDKVRPAASPLEAAEARFVSFQEALLDSDTVATMATVAARLQDDVSARGMHDVAIVPLGSGACGTISSGLKNRVSDVDYAFLYSGGPFPDAAYVVLEDRISRYMSEYQSQHGLEQVRPCFRLNVVYLHFPNFTSSQQVLTELGYFDRGIAYYTNNSRPQSQGNRFLSSLLISQPPEVNAQNRAFFQEALCELAQTDWAMWERVTSKLKRKWRDTMAPLKVKHLFGEMFEGTEQQERDKMEDAFGQEQVAEIYALIEQAKDLVGIPFNAYLDATGVAFRDRRSGHQVEQM